MTDHRRRAVIIDGDRYADRWILTGTHRGPLFGVAATGRSVRLESATFRHMDPTDW